MCKNIVKMVKRFKRTEEIKTRARFNFLKTNEIRSHARDMFST